jgi:hypothetical protein
MVSPDLGQIAVTRMNKLPPAGFFHGDNTQELINFLALPQEVAGPGLESGCL